MKCVFFTDATFEEFIKAKGELMVKDGKNLTHDEFLSHLLKQKGGRK